MTVLKASRESEGITANNNTVTKNQASATSSFEPSRNMTTSSRLGWPSQAARDTPRHHLLPAITLLDNGGTSMKVLVAGIVLGTNTSKPPRAVDRVVSRASSASTYTTSAASEAPENPPETRPLGAAKSISEANTTTLPPAASGAAQVMAAADGGVRGASSSSSSSSSSSIAETHEAGSGAAAVAYRVEAGGGVRGASSSSS
nr:uncharacterized protein LOC127339249 [Lolium perenne]